jgi:uncharacterized repeat protein (TIGR03847 family)
MSASFDFGAPEHFTAGTVGQPGQRVFYLQAREGRQLITLKVEKEHVGALADYLAGLLVQLSSTPEKAAEAPPLEEPMEPAWDVGAIAVGYDEESGRVVIIANEVTAEEAESEEAESEEAESEEAAVARFRITPAQAMGFVERARELMKGGRPLCPMCSRPRDAAGHVCPRSNGHVVTQT